jgi:hypothetical protein
MTTNGGGTEIYGGVADKNGLGKNQTQGLGLSGKLAFPGYLP